MNDVMTMNPFTPITDKDVANKRSYMTHFQDYLGEYTLSELESVFGEPVFRDSEGDFGDNKVLVEFCIKFDYQDPDNDWHRGYFYVGDWKNYRLDESDLYGTKVMWHIRGKGLSYEAIHQFKSEFEFMLKGE